ncbi:MAG TPA: laccase domain-containing protein, partial [Amphiplicatus sp.]|nr:laccase domain-containing protein [Amphiplicatus sp.]
MSGPPRLTVEALTAPGIAHGFFGRAGGVSSGVYASLNTGLGSDDDQTAIAENRARCAKALGGAPQNLVTLYQIHSATCVIVDEPWSGRKGPQADGMV